MGALYEDVEKFFGDIFAYYGKFLARYPIVFILISLLTSCLLGMGLLNLQYESSVQKLYTPMGSPAIKDQAKLSELFPDQTSEAFYRHQQLYQSTYGEIFIMGASEGENVLTPAIVKEVKKLFDDVMGIFLEKDERGHTYHDLCAARGDVCVIDGKLLLHALLVDSCLDPNSSYPILSPEGTGEQEDISTMLGEVQVENGCITAHALRIRFNLRHDSPRQRVLSLLWETKFLDKLASFESDIMTVIHSASESLDLELNEHVGNDTQFFALTIIIMIIYATFVSAGGNWVSTRVLLAHAGVVAALLAILASFGLLSLCGMKFVDICGVMPFLVLGVGVDDMFILMSGWRQTDVHASVEDRVSDTFRSSAISVTITSLTDLLAFCIGATSPFLSVKNFCIYTGVAIIICYFNQLTFFGGFLVLHARRVESSRHCVTCHKTKPRSAFKGDKNYSKLYVVCCSGHPPKKPGEDDSPCEKLPSSILPKLLLQIPTKTLVIIGFIVYLWIAIWGASQIKTGLKLENVVPSSSYLAKYMEVKNEYFSNQGPYVMFVIDEPVDYNNEEVITEIKEVMAKAIETGYLDTSFQISWLKSYLHFRENLTEPQMSQENFIPILRAFLKNHPEFDNDILFNEDFSSIQASRLYMTSLRFQDSTTEGNMMLMMREIAENSSLPMLAYSPVFIYYEHYVSILKNTLLAVGVAIIGMLFVALMFIPHPISVTCVTVTMVTIVVGMFGFMHFWGLALSAITTVQIILSVGFCVDFTVHISHAFMTATGKNRNERVMAALEKVGVPILNGALSSILGILMLAFANSYIFKSFFKTMLLVIVLGLAHSLLLLPVLLSFIGPRRTSKPRVFIPISSPPNRPAGDALAYKNKIEEQGRLRHERSALAAAMAEAESEGQVVTVADIGTHGSTARSHLAEDGVEQVELVQITPANLSPDEADKRLDIPLGEDVSNASSESSRRSTTSPLEDRSEPAIGHNIHVDPLEIPQIVLEATSDSSEEPTDQQRRRDRPLQRVKERATR